MKKILLIVLAALAISPSAQASPSCTGIRPMVVRWVNTRLVQLQWPARVTSSRCAKDLNFGWLVAIKVGDDPAPYYYMVKYRNGYFTWRLQ